MSRKIDWRGRRIISVVFIGPGPLNGEEAIAMPTRNGMLVAQFNSQTLTKPHTVPQADDEAEVNRHLGFRWHTFQSCFFKEAKPQEWI